MYDKDTFKDLGLGDEVDGFGCGGEDEPAMLLIVCIASNTLYIWAR